MKHILIVTMAILLVSSPPVFAQDLPDDTGKIDPPQVTTVVKTKIIVTKDPTLAGLLSAQFPGVGQMYCNKWLKGGVFLLGIAVLYGTANELKEVADSDTVTQDEKDKYNAAAGGFFIAGLAIHVWNVIDAIKTAERHNRKLVEQHTTKDGLFFDVKVGWEKASIGLARRM
jgi:hypothetical protein